MGRTRETHPSNSIDQFKCAPTSTFSAKWSVPPRVREPLLKRPLDFILSGFGLLFSSPLWLLIAAAIKLDDGGPVFYTQERVGLSGVTFKSWKFRSMRVETDKKFGPLQASEGDSRVTRVGRTLRPAAADELPQLWNIFRGDMSFVGPRALMTREIEVNGRGEAVLLESIPGYHLRHSVKPGLTGIAQVYAPRDISRRHKFLFDKIYVKKQTFCLDLKLIIVSFWISFNGKWESRAKRKF